MAIEANPFTIHNTLYVEVLLLQRVGEERRDELVRYLRERPFETFMLLSDLLEMDADTHEGDDTPHLIGYLRRGQVVAVQGLYASGRCLPHLIDESVASAMVADLLGWPVRWLMGIRRVSDPLLGELNRRGYKPSYDEQDYLMQLTRATFVPHYTPGVRHAIAEDAPAMARLRYRFEREYFHPLVPYGQESLYLKIAQRCVANGTFLVEREGAIASTVSVEARIPGLAHIGAVYTEPLHRKKGYAKGVVSAMCEDLLQSEEYVTLTVRKSNPAAIHVYNALGFQYRDEYRMFRFR